MRILLVQLFVVVHILGRRWLYLLPSSKLPHAAIRIVMLNNPIKNKRTAVQVVRLTNLELQC